jgi:hypothetical protein
LTVTEMFRTMGYHSAATTMVNSENGTLKERV